MPKKRSHPRSHLRSSRAKTNPRRTASEFPSGVLKRAKSQAQVSFDVTKTLLLIVVHRLLFPTSIAPESLIAISIEFRKKFI